MGKYDAIRGAGNVTVNAPPDLLRLRIKRKQKRDITQKQQKKYRDIMRKLLLNEIDISNNKNKSKSNKIEKIGSICTKELKLTHKEL